MEATIEGQFRILGWLSILLLITLTRTLLHKLFYLDIDDIKLS